MKRKAFIATSFLAVFIAIGLLGLPGLAKTTNCGGNSAALSYCQMLHMQLSLSIDEQGLHDRDSILDLPEKDRKELARLGKVHWTGDAKYLIKRSVELPRNDHEVVVVCDTSFDNVPQPTIYNGYKRTPRYAVALANGQTKLITPEEFAKIDRSLFVKASELIETEIKQ